MASNVGAVSHAPWGEYVARVGRMTVEQFAQFPAEDGWMYELHEGRLIAMPGPGYDHGAIQARIIMLLGSYMLDHGLGVLAGTCCYNLPLPNNTEELLCPDLSYVEPARKATMPLRGSYLVGAPDFVIEIASPSDTRTELSAKVSVYLQAGVRLIWVVWPASRTLDVWRLPASSTQPTTLPAGDTLDCAEIAPGFSCKVGDLFVT